MVNETFVAPVEVDADLQVMYHDQMKQQMEILDVLVGQMVAAARPRHW